MWPRRTLSSNNLITDPDLRTLRLRVAMSVHFLLVKSPIGELVTRQHHIHSGHCMLQLEVVSLCGQNLSLEAINQAQVEQGLVVALDLVLGQGGELLVGSIAGGSDVVGY